jgi:hypothetical protein
MPQGHTTHGSNLTPKKRGRPMRPGLTRSPAPAVGAPEHTIHEDGTYSNDFSTVAEKPGKLDLKSLKRDDILVFGRTVPVSSGVVHKIVGGGVYCRPDKNELPDLSRCIFYNWAEIKDLCTEVL